MFAKFLGKKDTPVIDPFTRFEQAVNLASQKPNELKGQIEKVVGCRKSITLNPSTPVETLIKLLVLDEKIDRLVHKFIPWNTRDKKTAQVIKEFNSLNSALREHIFSGNTYSLDESLKKSWVVQQLNEHLRQYNQQNQTSLVISPVNYLQHLKEDAERRIQSFLNMLDAFSASIQHDLSISDIRIKHDLIFDEVYGTSFNGCFNRRSLVLKSNDESHADIHLKRFFPANQALSYRYRIFYHYGQFREKVKRKVMQLEYPIGSSEEKERAFVKYEKEGGYPAVYQYGDNNRGVEYCQSMQIPPLDRMSHYAALAQYVRDYLTEQATKLAAECKSDKSGRSVDTGLKFFDELLLDEMIGLQESYYAKEISEDDFHGYKQSLCAIADLVIEKGKTSGRNLWWFLLEPGCELIHPQHKAHIKIPTNTPSPQVAETKMETSTEAPTPLASASEIVAYLKSSDANDPIRICDKTQLQQASAREQMSQSSLAPSAAHISISKPEIYAHASKESFPFWQNNDYQPTENDSNIELNKLPGSDKSTPQFGYGTFDD